MASQLSCRARAFSVEALLSSQTPSSSSASPLGSDSNRSSPTCSESPSSPVQDGNSTPAGVLEIGGVRMELCGQDLWQEFFKLGTEMIITKAGRRMFPSLKVRISGLDPDLHYAVWLDIVPLDDKRYRYVYHSSQWMIAGSGDPPPPHNVYLHQDAPALGRTWMGQGAVAFDRLKLTNNRRPLIRGQVSLHSMHKYQPRIHIQRAKPDEDIHLDPNAALTFIFDETSFTTVTAYQNQQITRLKIASNPFAKGFREATKTSRETNEDSSGSYPTVNQSIYGSTSRTSPQPTSETPFQTHFLPLNPIPMTSTTSIRPIRPGHKLMWLSPTLLATKTDQSWQPNIEPSNLSTWHRYGDPRWQTITTRLLPRPSLVPPLWPVILPSRQSPIAEWPTGQPNDESWQHKVVYDIS